jgi:hypothetical protein
LTCLLSRLVTQRSTQAPLLLLVPLAMVGAVSLFGNKSYSRCEASSVR